MGLNYSFHTLYKTIIKCKCIARALVHYRIAAQSLTKFGANLFNSHRAMDNFFALKIG